MTASLRTPAPTRFSWSATVSAYGMVLLGPLAAWLLWVSWSDGYASDASNVAWFASVATAVVAAGALAPAGWAHRVALSALGVVSTIATLVWWWSAEDESGLFMVGVLLATPLVAAAAPALLGLGALLRRHLGRRTRRDVRW